MKYLPLMLMSIGLVGHAEEPRRANTIYSPVGKRDPFKQPAEAMGRGLAAVNPLERFSIEQLQLRAILKGFGRNRAMFEDPSGNIHIVFEGDIFGRERGTISRILNTEVIVTERTFNYLGEENLYEKVLSLPNDSELLRNEETLENGTSTAPKAAGTREINSKPGNPPARQGFPSEPRKSDSKPPTSGSPPPSNVATESKGAGEPTASSGPTMVKPMQLTPSITAGTKSSK